MKNIRNIILNIERKLFLTIVVLTFVFTTAFSQNNVLKGIVIDANGKAVSGVIVTCSEKKDTTDFFGSFSISCSVKSKIVLSKEGFISKTVDAVNNQTIVITPTVYNKTVDCLYQQIPANELTTSVSYIGGESLEKNSVFAFSNSLYGRLAGLNVKQSNGDPGDDYASLLIRGKHTFTGSNSPLVLVDGFEREFNTLSVDEVESVTVLKDAASTALYGMDGANGVLLVTTKRGTQSGKSSVEFKVETGQMSPTRLPQFYGSYDYARFYQMAQLNDGVSPTDSKFLYSDAKLLGYKNNPGSKQYPNVNWMNETIRDFAPSNKYIMNFRGGNSFARYYVNVGYEAAEGIYKNTEHKAMRESSKSYSTNRNLSRINFRSNIDINVTKQFSVRLDLAGRLEDVNAPTQSSDAIFNNLYTFHPNVSEVYAGPGVFGGTNSYRNNPVAYINEMGYKTIHRRYFQSNINAKYDFSEFVKGLSAGLRANFDNSYSMTDGYSKTYAVVDTLAKIYGTNSALTSISDYKESELRSTNLEFFVDYSRTFGNNKIAALAMYHQDNYVTTTAFPNRRMTFSGKVSYSNSQKYFVDIAAQYGATENFIKGQRFGLFPAISGAWVISKEKFMNEVQAIDFLKLRVSTGLVGNQSIGGTRFGYLTLYNTNGTEKPIGNPDLTWEKAYKTDIGVDVTFLKDLNLGVTYFNELRSDILNDGSTVTPTYAGNTFGNINYGQVRSNGIETTISAVHQYKDWGYSVSANLTWLTNKVIRMKEITRAWDYLYYQGNPVGQRFGLEAIGLFQSLAEIDEAPVQSFGKVIPGSIRYKDQNNDNVINSDDYVAIGKSSTVPDFSTGLNIGVNYKGIYVDANFQAAIGRDINLRDDTEGALYSVSALYNDKNVSTFITNPWTPETASTANYPSLSIENAANNFQTSTYWLRNGNFLRLRTLEIGYNLPQNWIKGLKLSSVNLYLRGMNVFTLDNIGYFDPEVMEGYPVMKSYNVGLSVKL